MKHHAAIAARAIHRFAIDQHLARGMFFQPSKDPDQGGLTAARSADDADKFAPVNLEVDIAQRFHFALRSRIALVKAPHFEHHLALPNACEAIAHRF